MTMTLLSKRTCAERGHRKRAVRDRGVERWMSCENCGTYLERIGARPLSGTVAEWYAAHSQNLPRKSILRLSAA
jgi:hypothetical protein